MSFDGKIILITGANSGIGAACAEYFAKEGAMLALVGRRAEKFEQVLENIKESGVEAEPLVIVADVTVDAERIINETIEKYGRLDVLFNNAGIAIYGNIETINLEDYDSMMAINLRAVLELTQRAIPYLAESKGCIINNSSMTSMRPMKNLLGYCVTKAGLDQLTKCVAMDVADKGIRVNSINPGVIDTELISTMNGIDRTDDKYAAMIETISNNYPVGRCGKVEDCVNAVAFLANDKSDFLTGVLLVIDGGITIKSL